VLGQSVQFAEGEGVHPRLLSVLQEHV